MRPLSEFPRDRAQHLRGIFCDVDDTLTLHGRLVPEAYRALCNAVDAGLRVVPVTGRPGGFAEVLTVQWPVDAMIAENGALYVMRGGEHRFWDDAATREAQRKRLDALASDVLARIPFARIVDDQPLRRVDVAFDVGERQHLSPEQIETINQAIRSHGARALTSTVHAHAYYGDHDKAKMIERLAGAMWNETRESLRAHYLFVGDSPNDQAAFAYFPLSVGVANVAHFASELNPTPTFVAARDGGYGFAELVDLVLAARR